MACQGEPVEPAAKVTKPLSNPASNEPLPTRVLVLLDYDDTLIPTTIIQRRAYKINHQNTDPKERIALGRYAKSLEGFIRKILTINTSEKVDSLTQIVTTASRSWLDSSLGHSCGSLWMNMIAPFNNLLRDHQVGVVSVRDFQKKNKQILGNIEVAQCKQVMMYELMKQFFGCDQSKESTANEDRKQSELEMDEVSTADSVNVSERWKVLCIGDSAVEFHASKNALDYYLNERSADALRGINVSLHRVKFDSQPDSFQKLESELRWCTERIDAIVHEKHESADYVYSNEKGTEAESK